MRISLLPPWAKLAGAVALSLAALAAMTDWRHARDAREQLRICTMAAGDIGKPVDACPRELKAAVVARRQAAACEAALTSDDLWTISTACGAQVRDRVARQRVAEANLADARAQLAQAEQRALAAVSRAEARARTSAERKSRATAAISAAPRDAGGLLSCDADCLRNLSGGSARADR
jgi:hypothetical protein